MQPGKIGITALITLLTATTTAFTPNFPVPLYALPVVAQTQSNRKAEADRLVEQGNKQIDTNQLQFALLSYQEALANYQQIGDRESEKTTLTKLGDTYAALKEFSIAIEYHKQALSIWRELLDRQWEEKKRTFSENTNSSALPGQVNSQDTERKRVADVNYLYHGQYLMSQRSIYEGMLLRDRVIIGMAQNRTGVSLPQVLPEVLEVYQQELAESRKLGNRIIEGETLNLIGTTYIYLGEYSQAIQSYQQALAIFQDIALQPREEEIFNGLPTEEEFSKAPSEVEAVQLALTMIPSEIRIGSLFNNLGEVYRRQGKYAQALASYQEALSNFQYLIKTISKLQRMS
jgi:tetratricopeptide (TPR) repeat protein